MFLFFISITFVLLHVFFLTVVQFKMATFMFMGTLFVRIKHCPFGLENTMFCLDEVQNIFSGILLLNKFCCLDGFGTRM
ncbi:hypothetical protein AB205_0002510 [Aquarana catesbeiana]|uniref:Uncharacterized protein n=1 Tax=Aquarana catesbeiana TaxID=8400 RepID=A0A2G9R5Q3_AQUCT|nr:hypothetical protein AB205_0002510 [Aquarana catesbeiana]